MVFSRALTNSTSSNAVHASQAGAGGAVSANAAAPSNTALYIGWRMWRYGPLVISLPPARGIGRMLKLPGRLCQNVHATSARAARASTIAAADTDPCAMRAAASPASNNSSPNCKATSTAPIADSTYLLTRGHVRSFFHLPAKACVHASTTARRMRVICCMNLQFPAPATLQPSFHP